jgi:hypothetical protein
VTGFVQSFTEDMEYLVDHPDAQAVFAADLAYLAAHPDATPARIRDARRNRTTKE